MPTGEKKVRFVQQVLKTREQAARGSDPTFAGFSQANLGRMLRTQDPGRKRSAEASGTRSDPLAASLRMLAFNSRFEDLSLELS